MFRKLSALLTAPILLLALASCADGADPAAADVSAASGAVILDVRTPEEYAIGHIEGAQLLDFNSGEFAAALPQLAPDVEYLVYCRSGNRSGQAMTLMEDAGITNVTNLGSLEQAAEATSIAIVN